MAWYKELKGPALDAYRKMVSSLMSKAKSELGLSQNELVLRGLRPEDIGASSPDFYFGLDSAAWSTLISSQTVNDNRFVGINGVVIGPETALGGTSMVSQLKITRKGSVARYWNTQPIHGFEGKIGYTDDPVTVDQNTTLTVDAWARTAGSIENFSLLGAVVEKRGLLINP